MEVLYYSTVFHSFLPAVGKNKNRKKLLNILWLHLLFKNWGKTYINTQCIALTILSVQLSNMKSICFSTGEKWGNLESLKKYTFCKNSNTINIVDETRLWLP